jgi:regulation of enolase protein 1 (concanavalin A-like superfamily)
MRSKCLKASILALLLAGWSVNYANAGSILRVFYDNIPGTTVASLTDATNAAGQKIYPNGPNKDGSMLQSEILSGVLEGAPPPTQPGPENYGSMFQGFLEIPQTGAYTFYISSADSSELWLSTDVNPANKQKIASVSGAVAYHSYTAQSSQTSATMNMVRGQKYYFQAIHKAGTGNDFVTVAWLKPGDTAPTPIPLQYVQGYPNSFWADPSIVTQPLDMTVAENSTVTFSADVNASEPVSYQWYRGTQQKPNPTVAITDEILSSLSFTVKPSDNGTTYRLLVGAKSGVVMTRVAKLTVIPDTVKPVVSSIASSMFDPTKITVTFSKVVQASTLTDLANYSIDNGVMIYGATAGTAANSVDLYVSELSINTSYVLTVNGIKDIATTPNTIVANTQVAFTLPVVVLDKVYANVSGGGTNDFLNNAAFQAGDYTTLYYRTGGLEGINSGSGWDNTIQQMQAYLVAPATGDYKFSVAADDGVLLYLSTDENPANKVAIAGHNSWTADYDYTKLPEQMSKTITLVAGNRYYVELVEKNGGGGFGMSATWQKPGEPAITNTNRPIPASALEYFGQTGPMSLTKGPSSQTVGELNSVTFTVPTSGLQGLPPYTYQWYRNGMPIAGATSISYSVPAATMADNGAVFTMIVNNNFSMAASTNATLTVTPDTTLPTVQGLAFYNNTITLTFNKLMDSASLTNPANYVVKSQSGTVTGVTVTKLNDKQVTLNASLVTGAAYTVDVMNVKDTTAAGNVVATTSLSLYAMNFTVAGFAIPNNNTFSSSVTADKASITANTGDIWNNNDSMVFAYQQFTGNFDYKVRLESLDKAADWSKAGWMVRTDVNSDGKSRNINLVATPGGGLNSGKGLYAFQWRDSNGGGSSSTSGRDASYPNTWIRLTRLGSTIYGFTSSNGVDWSLYAQRDTAANGGAYPDTVYVGIAVGSNNGGGGNTKAVLSGFGPVIPAPFDFTTKLSNVTTLENLAQTFSVAVSGPGPYLYNWYQNGTNLVASSTTPSYTTPTLALGDNGSTYRVDVVTPYATIVGQTVTLTVNKDTTPPAIVSVGSLYGSRDLFIKFSKPLNSGTATAAGNYSITGGRGTITNMAYSAESSIVRVTYSLPMVAPWTVKAPKVADLAGNLCTNSVMSTNIRMKDSDIGSLGTDSVTGLPIFTDPVQPGLSWVYSDTDFEMVAGGSDIWNNADGFHFTYQELTGNFDVRVRVESLRYVTDNWAKAGLMVRESTNGGSRNLSAVVGPTAGVNQWEQNYRGDTNGGTTGWGNTASPVTYPNAWIRLIRMGDQFTVLRSTDGKAWEQRGNLTMVFTNKVLVGMAASAHNNSAGTTTVAKFHNYLVDTNMAYTYPQIAAISGGADLNTAYVTFSEAMFAGSATSPSNYVFDNGLTVTSATIDATGTMVSLKTSQQIAGAVYTLAVKNVQSAAGFMVPASSFKAFTAWSFSKALVKRDVWNGIGNPLSNLKGSAKYPNNPDSTSYVNTLEVANTGVANYSQRLTGFIVPAQSGNYTFYIASSGQSELYLSTNELSSGKALVAKVTTSSGFRQYGKDAAQKSASIALEAGKSYYVEAISAQDTGADYLSVTWTAPGVTATPADGAVPISGAYVGYYATPDATLFVTNQPVNATAIAGWSATFSVGVYASSTNVYYQWQEQLSGSAQWTDFAGANGSTLNIQAPQSVENGALIRALVFIPGASAISGTATLTVTPNTEPPVVASITSVMNSTNLVIKFNEPLDAASATNVDNYIIYTAVGIPIYSVTLLPDRMTVVIAMTAPLNNRVVVWIEKIKDGAGNMMAEGFFTSQIVGLTIQRNGDNILVTWPVTDQKLVLESGSINGNWNAVQQPVTVDGDLNKVIIPLDSENKMFRLNQ